MKTMRMIWTFGGAAVCGVAVIGALSLTPEPTPAVNSTDAWEQIQSSDKPAEIIAFLQTHPDSPHATEAYARLEALVSSAPVEVTRASSSALELNGPDTSN